MTRYALRATVNYRDDEAETPDYSARSMADVRTWVATLIETEPDATSFLVIIVPIKAETGS